MAWGSLSFLDMCFPQLPQFSSNLGNFRPFCFQRLFPPSRFLRLPFLLHWPFGATPQFTATLLAFLRCFPLHCVLEGSCGQSSGSLAFSSAACYRIRCISASHVVVTISASSVRSSHVFCVSASHAQSSCSLSNGCFSVLVCRFSFP